MPDELTALINEQIDAQESASEDSVPPVEDEAEPEQPEDAGDVDTDELDDLEGEPEELPEDEGEPTDEELDEEFDDDELDDVELDEVDEDDELDEAAEQDDLDLDQPVTVKVGGEEVEVTLDEALKGYQRDADYRRKTQELAEQRREVQQVYDRMKEWYEEKSSDPAGWVRDIADQTGTPHETVADALARSDDAQTELILTIKTLAERGDLSDELVETFGLEDIANTAVRDDRVSKLEQRLEQQERERQQQLRQQQILQEFQSQWEQIKSQEGLEFSSQQDDYAAMVDLMKFARDEQIVNLQTAWAAKQYETGRQQTTESADGKADAESAAKKRKREAARKRKRKASAISRQSSGGARSSKPEYDISDAKGMAALIEDVGAEKGLL